MKAWQGSGNEARGLGNEGGSGNEGGPGNKGGRGLGRRLILGMRVPLSHTSQYACFTKCVILLWFVFYFDMPELKGQCWGSSQVFLSQEGSSTQPSGGSRQTCTYVSCWLSQCMGGSLVTLWPKFVFFSLFLCSASSLPPLLSLITLSPSSVFLPSFPLPLLHSCSRGGERVGHIATDQKQLWQTFRAGGTHYQTQGTLSL